MRDRERELLQQFGGRRIWRRDWSETFQVRGYDAYAYHEEYLWEGQCPTPLAPRCSYCGSQMQFRVYTLKRPVPPGARDLGLADPAAAWLCPKCGHKVQQVVLNGAGWPFEQALICHQCWQPFTVGEQLLAHAQFHPNSHYLRAYHAAPPCADAVPKTAPPLSRDQRAEQWKQELSAFTGVAGCIGICLAILGLIYFFCELNNP